MPARKKSKASSKPKKRPGKKAAPRPKQAKATPDLRYAVVLTAYAADGSIVIRRRMPFEKFYDGQTQLIDSDTYGKKRRITRVTGTHFDDRGYFDKHWENEYRSNGELKHTWEMHEDGMMREWVFDARGNERLIERKKGQTVRRSRRA